MIGKSLGERVGILESRVLSAEVAVNKLEQSDTVFSDRMDQRLRRMEVMVYMHTVILGGIGALIWYFMDQLVKAFVAK